MSRATSWGNPCLFTAGTDRSEPRSFRLRVNGGAFGPVLGNLALATAQARAAALDGAHAEIASADGTAVAVTHAGEGFSVTSCGPALWPDRCRRLLIEHG
jgi:hypothetical protein